MQSQTVYKLFALVVIPSLAYLSTHSYEAVYKMSILMGIPMLLFFIWMKFTHKNNPIYLLGDKNIISELLEGAVYEEKKELPNGDVVFDLMFCQLVNVRDADEIHYLDENAYYFYHDKEPPNYFKGTVVVDEIMKQRSKMPNSKLCVMKDFWYNLQVLGKFD